MATLKAKHIPNLITLLRLIVIPPMLYCLIYDYYLAAVILFVVGGFSDGVDGFLARHFNWTSRFGAIVDPLADKLLVFSSFVTLVYMGQVPLWLLLVIVGRDFIIISGAWAYHMMFGSYEIKPFFSSKLNTCVQILLVTLILCRLALFHIPDEVLAVLMCFLLITSIISLLQYVYSWGRKAWQEHKLSKKN